MLHLEIFNDCLKSLNQSNHSNSEILDDYYLYGYYGKYYIRASYNIIEIGVAETFCRWANSVDFTLDYKFIKDEESVSILHEAVIKLIKDKKFNPKWSDRIDIYPEFRKMKRKFKHERKLIEKGEIV